MTNTTRNNSRNLIILLDLNYTLVCNSDEIKFIKPYQKKIIAEKYRDWLVDLIKDFYVILITARPKYQEKVTTDSIKEKLGGWMPNEMYFQEENDRPPVAKEKLLQKYILPKHGLNIDYLAIESNPRTKKMYKKYQIHSVSVYDEDGLDLRNQLEIRSD
jgi:hypothetical protein